MIRILFVCLGNICRSPMAEGVFKKHLKDQRLEHLFQVDSAGTSAYHIGKQPDHRMCQTARQFTIELDHKARQFTRQDLLTFDHILAMDTSNFDHMVKIAGGELTFLNKIKLMRDFDLEKDAHDVPDPYYGGLSGFEEVYHILHRSTLTLLEHIKVQHQIR